MPQVILVVDDEDVRFHSDMDALFQRQGDYLVVHAYSWSDGYARALKHFPDLRLVLIDQLLDHDRRGTDLVRLVRSRLSVIPIVLVTADDNAAVMDEAQRAGATAFFPKKVVYGANSAISRTFVYWAQGGAFPTGHLDGLTTFIRAFAHRSRGCLQRFKTANGAGSSGDDLLSGVQLSEIDDLDAEFKRIVEVYRTFEKRVVNETDFDVTELVRDEIRQLSSTNRTFEWRDTGEIVSIFADRELVRLAIREIFDNAVKYSSKLGKGERALHPIEICVSRQIRTEVEYCVIEVRDFGQGIDDDDIGIIHNAYVRGRNTVHTNTYGSGLGLDLVRRVLETVRVGEAVGYCDVRAPRDLRPGTVAELYIPIGADEVLN